MPYELHYQFNSYGSSPGWFVVSKPLRQKLISFIEIKILQSLGSSEPESKKVKEFKVKTIIFDSTHSFIFVFLQNSARLFRPFYFSVSFANIFNLCKVCLRDFDLGFSKNLMEKNQNFLSIIATNVSK